jgi:hypothetical protein
VVRSRRNGLTGTDLKLYCFFYQNDELQSPSSIHGVDIYNQADSIIATYSNIVTEANGIKHVIFEAPEWPKGVYNDTWRFTNQAGEESQIKELEFIIRSSEFNQSQSFSLNNFVLKADIITERFSLSEKKWLHFEIKDALGNFKAPDTANVLFKESNSSNVYIVDSAISDGLNVYYFFNSSSLRAEYPDDITRTKNYEWIIDIDYREQTYRLDPILFNFTEV